MPLQNTGTNGRGKSFSDSGSFNKTGSFSKTQEIQVHSGLEVWALGGACVAVLIGLIIECWYYGLI
jgi:hypothetical protein